MYRRGSRGTEGAGNGRPRPRQEGDGARWPRRGTSPRIDRSGRGALPRWAAHPTRPSLGRWTMKAILTAAVMFGLCGLAWAEDTKADPTGTWKCEYEIGGQKRESTLAIK